MLAVLLAPAAFPPPSGRGFFSPGPAMIGAIPKNRDLYRVNQYRPRSDTVHTSALFHARTTILSIAGKVANLWFRQSPVVYDDLINKPRPFAIRILRIVADVERIAADGNQSG